MDNVIKQSEQVLKERVLLAIAEHEEKIKPFEVAYCSVTITTRRTNCGKHSFKNLEVTYSIPNDTED